MNPEERDLFLNFFNDILEDNLFYGKNKASAKLPPIINHETLKNYAIFLNNKFYHYHLGKDFSLNPKITYKNYNPSFLVPQTIKFLNDQEGRGRFKTCDNLINYQMIEEEIIIYNITKHSSWKDLINNIIFQGISMDYTTYQYCNEVINDNNINCLCFSTPHISTVGIKDVVSIHEKVNVGINRSHGSIEKMVIENLNAFSKDKLYDFLISDNLDLLNLNSI